MPKFPEPPAIATLRALGPALHELDAGTELWRIFRGAGPYAATWNLFRQWGPVATARFDHHLPPPRLQQRGVLYAATSIAAAIAEVFQVERHIDVISGSPMLVGFRSSRAVRLLDLTGLWPTAAGASMNIASGPRARAQRWSRAIYTAFPEAEGIWYGSSMHANTPCVALYERAADALTPDPLLLLPLAHPVLADDLRRLAAQLRYRMS